MQLSIFFGFFLLGTILGSFYNVVASRLPKGESIITPPSHCPFCQHKLQPWELIPIFSYLLQRGKCTNCKKKISIFYPISEIVCGLLFGLAFLSFGFSWNLLIALTFVSMLIIVILSDYYYMIIEDSVLIFFGSLLIIETICIYGFYATAIHMFNGMIAFGIMYLLKLLGDFLFKKESLGGGDIKLMLIIGFMIGWDMSIITIFLSAFLALPVSIGVLKSKKDHEIPYGPFLAFASLIIYFTHCDFNMLIQLLTFH